MYASSSPVLLLFVIDPHFRTNLLRFIFYRFHSHMFDAFTIVTSFSTYTFIYELALYFLNGVNCHAWLNCMQLSLLETFPYYFFILNSTTLNFLSCRRHLFFFKLPLLPSLCIIDDCIINIFMVKFSGLFTHIYLNGNNNVN